MITIIAGGRHDVISPEQAKWLDTLGITHVISGGASGVDRYAELWANSRGLPIKVMKAKWDKYGRRAGPIRNALMAREADAVVIFPGGKGTANMKSVAQARGLRIFESNPINESPLFT